MEEEGKKASYDATHKVQNQNICLEKVREIEISIQE